MTGFQIFMVILFIPTIWIYSMGVGLIQLKYAKKPEWFANTGKLTFISVILAFIFYLIVFTLVMVNPDDKFTPKRHDHVIYPKTEYRKVDKILYEEVPIQK